MDVSASFQFAVDALGGERWIVAPDWRGYGLSEGGYESGISTIAVPVTGEEGRIVAAVSVTVPSQNIDATLVDGLAGQVCRAAADLSSRLRLLPQTRASSRPHKLAA
jgi:pimeloyl-ACP methyl ester carboxylesterase